MRSFFGISGILIVSVVSAVARASDSSKSEQFSAAVRTYKEAEQITQRTEQVAKFRKAELLFRRLVTNSGAPPHPDLLCNLGNASLRGDHVGHAILAYRQALKIDPDHRRAEQNLRYARSLLPDWLPRPEEPPTTSSLLNWFSSRTRSELSNLAALTFVSTMLLLAIGVRFHRIEVRNIALLPGIVWLMLITVLFSSRSSPPAAVVTVDEVQAKSSDSPNAPNKLLQALPSGTEVQLLETRSNWSKVSLADGRDVWIPNESIERIRDVARSDPLDKPSS